MNATTLLNFPDTTGMPRMGWTGVGVAVLLHAAAFGIVLTHQTPRLVHSDTQPIMVSFIVPQAKIVTPPEPVIQPPPKPVVRHKPKPPEIIASKRPDPAPIAAPVAPKPEPVVEPPPPAPAPKAVAAPREAEVAPPRFGADYLRNPKPYYPGMSRRLREEGTVLVRVYVSPQGTPERVELNKSSGYARLDESAVETIRQHWKFAPARQGGVAVGAWVLVPIAFTLEG